jgi:hypothetical protein
MRVFLSCSSRDARADADERRRGAAKLFEKNAV